MTDKNNFDFDDFMKKTLEAGDDDLRRNQMMTDVGDNVAPVMAQLAPRIYAVIKRQTMNDPHSVVHHNAVLNAAIYSFATWIAACVPPGPEGDAIGEPIPTVVAESIRRAIAQRTPESLTAVGDVSLIGDRLLLQDANEDMVIHLYDWAGS